MSCDYSPIGVLDSNKNIAGTLEKMELIQKIIAFFFKRKWLGILLVLGLAWGVGISTFYRGAVSPKQRTDLTVFLKAGEMVHEGRANHIYGIENARHWHYVYPPILAILLAPVSKWPLGATVGLAYLLSIACLVGTILLSRRLPEKARSGFISSHNLNNDRSLRGARQGDAAISLYESKIASPSARNDITAKAVRETYETTSKPAPWQITLAMIFCLPMFLNTLTRGQFGIITLFFMAAVFYNYLKQRKILTGLLLAFAIALKISPLAFLVFFFLLKREWKTLLGTLVGLGLFFFLLPSLAIGFQQNWELLKIWQHLMSISQSDTAYQNYLWGELFTPFAEDNQSLYSVVTRFSWPSEAVFIGHSNALVRFVTSGVGILFLVLPFMKAQKASKVPAQDPLRSFAEFSLFPMIMLFTSPVTQIHHYTVVYFLYLAALMIMDRTPRGSRAHKYLGFSLWACALSLMLGMIFPLLGYWGIPLWGSIFLWGVVLCYMNKEPVHGT
ncbi:MAG: hypothetical protein A2351_06055 [Omnitrophica bacterium RIFOXYB12_FULL_50_7]|nr:MAG: hypothetical protein A2351_06055 [Omnitrophica bacterium RIFOXYB12_FULL_50_7]